MRMETVLSELNRLKAEGLIVDYAIGGAVAAQVYIEVSDTADVDVFVAFNTDGVHPLAPLGPIWANLIRHGAIQQDDHLIIGGWPVQLLAESSDLNLSAISHAIEATVEGVSGRFMDPPHLAALALKAGRSKDYPRIVEMLQRGVLTAADLRLLVAKFGLEDRLETLWTRFPDAAV